ncbi:hypothetical protein LEP1GSC061_1428 [Leptospira wolffii serovar Khorat str. Khorat-H2]|nr:hypothetical protein LEP1GSC061_1428 [Leptospira wolffii serovar Khorat str. Khorat-H2]
MLAHKFSETDCGLQELFQSSKDETDPGTNSRKRKKEKR